MPVDTEVGLGPRDFVLDGDPASPPRKWAQQRPTFWPMFIVARRSSISETTELV